MTNLEWEIANNMCLIVEVQMTESSTVNLNIGPKKYWGWCKENDVEHHWKGGPTLTCNPPILTRQCVNCGLKQYKREEWIDAP